MPLEGGKISGNQLIYLIISFLVGHSILGIPADTAGIDAWLAIIGGLVISLIFIAIFTTLAMRFPGKSPVEYNDIIYGPYLGKFISVMQLWFFFHIGSLVLRSFGDFFIGIIFPETPMEVIIIFIALICASAVRNGIEVITRCSQVVLGLTILTVLSVTLLSIKDVDYTNLLPVFETPLIEFIKASLGTAVFPFGDTVAFLMVFPFLNNTKEASRSTILAVLIAGLLLIIDSVRNITVLGVTVNIATYPSFQMVRLINIGDIFTRLEITVISSILAMGFLKSTILYYGTVLGTAQLFKLRSYLPLVFPIGIIMIVLSITQFENVIENFVFGSEISTFYSLPFQVGIPLLSLLIAVIRRLPKNC